MMREKLPTRHSRSPPSSPWRSLDSTVNLTLTATLLGSPRTTPTTIQLGTEGTATAGTDYTDFTLTLTIPANDPNAMVALPIELLNDDTVENPRP